MWRRPACLQVDCSVLVSTLSGQAGHEAWRSGSRMRRTWPAHGLGKWEVPAGDKFSRERGRRKR